MVKGYPVTVLIAFLYVILFLASGCAPGDSSEKHVLVSMRMIGHQILLKSGDSTSLVLPVKKEDDRYIIQFGSDFQFNPEELVATIDGVVKKTNVANSYFVEVAKCETGEIIYSYEIGNPAKADVIPCATRMPARACYNILITIGDTDPALAKWLPIGKKQSIFFTVTLILVTTLISIGLYRYFQKKIPKPEAGTINPDMIRIGEYRFDRINSELLFQDKRVMLSAKESELLLLLYSAANTTVEREVILKNIWGDEGDYIGRTLDVCISKLRKKLEADKSLKIVNSRGIGYKLILNPN
jgi:DNA-binding response OmpR family regulator